MSCLAHQRRSVLVSGTWGSKPQPTIAIARTGFRDGAGSRLLNVVDLVNRLEAEGRARRSG